MSIRKTHIKFLLLMTLIVVSCSTGPVSPTATPSPLPPTSKPTLAAREPTSSPSPEPTAIEIPAEGKVSADGPWLTYYDIFVDRLIVIDQDGSSWQSLEIPLSRELYSIPTLFPAPSGGYLAYVNPIVVDIPRLELELNIIQIPSGETVYRIPLIGDNWQQQIAEAGLASERYHFENDVLGSMEGEGAISWSPDGEKLAFTGAIEGPSSDLYLLDLSSGDVTRLTSGPLQAYILDWSPDNAWIVHLSVDTFGTGGGWGVDALWAAAADGSSVVRVASLERATFIEGWQSETDFIATEYGGDFGPEALFRYSIDKSTREMLFKGYVPAIAFDDKVHTMAFAKNPAAAKYFEYAPGIYMISPDSGEEIIVEQTEDTSESIAWVDSIAMYAAALEERTILFDTSGNIHVQIPRGGRLSPSPDGSILAIHGDRWLGQPGLAFFTSTGEELAQPASEWVFLTTWSPDSSTAFYETESNLYVFSAENMTATLLKQDVPDWSGEYYWIPGP